MSERSILKATATNLDDILRARLDRKLEMDLLDLAPLKTETDGWSSTLASVGNDKVLVEIWLDRYAGHETRRFWYGLSAVSKNADFRKGVQSLPSHLRPIRKFDYSHARKFDRKGNVFLTKALKPEEFGRPIYESYSNDRQYLGIYDVALAASSSSPMQVAARAQTFMEDVIEYLVEEGEIEEGREVGDLPNAGSDPKSLSKWDGNTS